MGTDDGYPWTLQPGESSRSYEAFRLYLQMGPTRSHARVAAELGKSETQISDWGARDKWTSRVRAYEIFLMEAQTDGAVDWITSARSETQELADKLRGLLSTRLDDCIRTRTDPTVRWSQAASVLLKMQEHGIPPVDDTKMAAELDRVAKLLEKVTGDQERV